jgi:hypothetical protein
VTEQRNHHQNEYGAGNEQEPDNDKNRVLRNHTASGRKSKSSSAPPGITPGYDFIWGSDQDDLMDDPDYIADPDDLDDLYRLDPPDGQYDR